MILSCIVACAMVGGLHANHANHKERSGQVDRRSLMLARVCEYEAEGNASDCVAIWYVANKRARLAGVEPMRMLRRYSTLWRSRSSRARRIRISQPAPALLSLSAEIVCGMHRDPCAAAVHWGGRTDKPRGRMIKIRCAVPTRNTFYALGKR
jgi:hypothetical protein